jgi:urease subunit gamma
MKVTATIKGESDIPPFVKIFDYDEDAFFASAKVIEEKIQRNLKINTNEALTTYCAYAIRAIHAGRKDNEIQKGASKILSENSVMVGVPQTLRIITFEVAIKNKTRKITIREPIPTSNYIMAGN